MSKPSVSLETVWQMGAALHGVDKSTGWGNPALKVRGQLMVCVPTHRSAEPGSLMIRLDRNDREPLLAESPDLYYITDHYVDYDGVLVRLAQLNPELLSDLLAMAHRFVMRKSSRQRPNAKSR